MPKRLCYADLDWSEERTHTSHDVRLATRMKYCSHSVKIREDDAQHEEKSQIETREKTSRKDTGIRGAYDIYGSKKQRKVGVFNLPH